MLRRAEMSKKQYYDVSSPKHTTNTNKDHRVADVAAQLKHAVRPSVQQEIRGSMMDSINSSMSKHEHSQNNQQSIGLVISSSCANTYSCVVFVAGRWRTLKY